MITNTSHSMQSKVGGAHRTHTTEVKHAREYCRSEGERTLWCNDNGSEQKRHGNLTQTTGQNCGNDSCR